MERRRTVGAGNHDMELGAVLAIIDSSFRGNTGTPESTFDVGEAGWVFTASAGVNGGVTLKVDVEGSAEIGGITELLALDSVVGLESGQAQVGIGVDGCLQVHKGPCVALGSWGIAGGRLHQR